MKATEDNMDLRMVVEKHTPWGKEVINGRSQPAKKTSTLALPEKLDSIMAKKALEGL